MRTRSFIGLILLVAMLIVVSTPALLNPSADGIERLAIKAGIVDDTQAALQREREQDAAQSTDPVKARLVFKGHEVDAKTGDLRDTATAQERASNQRGRLVSGSQRQLMPGQLEDQDAFSRPVPQTADGMTLDDTGCPVIPDGMDPLAVMGNPTMKAQLTAKVAQADDPAACTTSINELVTEAKTAQTVSSSASPSSRRADSIRRRSLNGIAIDLTHMSLLAQMFDVGSLQEQFDALDASATRP